MGILGSEIRTRQLGKRLATFNLPLTVLRTAEADGATRFDRRGGNHPAATVADVGEKQVAQ